MQPMPPVLKSQEVCARFKKSAIAVWKRVALASAASLKKLAFRSTA